MSEIGAIVKGNGTDSLIKVNQSLAQMPMWHRRGGIVVTAAKIARNVASQDWSKLVLDAFPRRMRRGSGVGGGKAAAAAATATTTTAAAAAVAIKGL